MLRAHVKFVGHNLFHDSLTHLSMAINQKHATTILHSAQACQENTIHAISMLQLPTS